MTSTTVDHYATLGIPTDATADDIEAAWLRLRGAVHPDKHASDKRAEQHFARVQAAYRELSNPASRAAYDTARAAVGGSTGGADNVTGVVDLVGQIARDAQTMDPGRMGVNLLDKAASPEGRTQIRTLWQGLVNLMR